MSHLQIMMNLLFQHMQSTANRLSYTGALGTEPVTYIGGKDQSLIRGERIKKRGF